MKELKVGCATLNQTPIDWENNYKNIVDAIESAKKQQVTILCLPELCISGYGCEDLFFSDWVLDKSFEQLLKIKEHCEEIAVAVGLPVKFEGNVYNCACLISNKIILGFSAKQFLANDGVHYEHRWFTPWQAGKESVLKKDKVYPIGELIYEVNGYKIGFEICEDAWRINRPACRLKDANIDLILNPSASPFTLGKTHKRKELIAESSKDFDVVYLYTNLLGNESGRLIFDGECLIAQKGEIIAENERFSFKQFNLITTTISLEAGNSYVSSIEAPEMAFKDAVSLGLFDYLRKSGLSGFVISLSGGADSTICSVLISEMVKKGIAELGINGFKEILGLKNEETTVKGLTRALLTTVYQGTENSSEETLEAARELSKELNAEFHHWLIDEEIKSYRQKVSLALGNPLSWEKDDITLQNIQARARSPIIWMMANKKKALLIATNNRSEGDVGYTTMDGDTSGSIAPIAGIDKIFIRKWLVWAEKELGYQSLKYVNSLQPSAELRPQDKTQTDEDDLMPYTIMVEIERLAIGKYLSPIGVYEKLKEKKLEDDQLLINHIIVFFRLWARNQWKRERFAPSFYLDEFNTDPRSWFRFPILSSGFKNEIHALEKIKASLNTKAH